MSHLVSAVRASEEPKLARRGVSHAAFVGVSALCFAVSATATIVASTAMAAMGEMPMPGGWSLSAAWTPMCGQTWAGVATSFIGMWIAMMVTMMLPSLVPMLWRYREAVGDAGSARLGRLTMLVGVGYFVVWTAFGIAVFALGVALTSLAMAWPALAHVVPAALGMVVLVCGALQFTAWKARRLECCRAAPGHCRKLRADARTAWRHGLRLGLRCSYCCAGLTVVLLAVGVMDLRAMALMTAAITGERLVPGGERVARLSGAVIVGVGVILIARASGFV